MINDGGSAFPQHGWSKDPDVRAYMAQAGLGMSLRDYFAAKAMNGILSDPLIRDVPEDIAVVAYQLADAMLAVRAKAGAK